MGASARRGGRNLRTILGGDEFGLANVESFAEMLAFEDNAEAAATPSILFILQ